MQVRDAKILQLQAELQATAVERHNQQSLREVNDRAERAERAVAELQQYLALVDRDKPGRLQVAAAHLQHLSMGKAQYVARAGAVESARHRWVPKDPWTTQLLSTGLSLQQIVTL